MNNNSWYKSRNSTSLYAIIQFWTWFRWTILKLGMQQLGQIQNLVLRSSIRTHCWKISRSSRLYFKICFLFDFKFCLRFFFLFNWANLQLASKSFTRGKYRTRNSPKIERFCATDPDLSTMCCHVVLLLSSITQPLMMELFVRSTRRRPVFRFLLRISMQHVVELTCFRYV